MSFKYCTCNYIIKSAITILGKQIRIRSLFSANKCLFQLNFTPFADGNSDFCIAVCSQLLQQHNDESRRGGLDLLMDKKFFAYYFPPLMEETVLSVSFGQQSSMTSTSHCIFSLPSNLTIFLYLTAARFQADHVLLVFSCLSFLVF